MIQKLKLLLYQPKEESEKVGLKLNIQKTKIMASGPITLWQIHGEKWKQRETIFLGSKVTADGDCSNEIKRHLHLGRKGMTNLDSILKSRDNTLLTKVHLVKAMVFPVIMCGFENWTIKKAECWRIDAFELSCWRRLLRVPWTARRSNHSILKEVSPAYSLEYEWCRSSNTLANLCEELTHWKRPRSWERLKAGGEGNEMARWHHWLNGHEFEPALRVGDGQGDLACCSPWGRKELDTTEQLNWTELRYNLLIYLCKI